MKRNGEPSHRIEDSTTEDKTNTIISTSPPKQTTDGQLKEMTTTENTETSTKMAELSTSSEMESTALSTSTESESTGSFVPPTYGKI